MSLFFRYIFHLKIQEFMKIETKHFYPKLENSDLTNLLEKDCDSTKLMRWFRKESQLSHLKTCLDFLYLVLLRSLIARQHIAVPPWVKVHNWLNSHMPTENNQDLSKLSKDETKDLLKTLCEKLDNLETREGKVYKKHGGTEVENDSLLRQIIRVKSGFDDTCHVFCQLTSADFWIGSAIYITDIYVLYSLCYNL